MRSFGVLRFPPPVRAPLTACVHTYGVHMRVLRLCAFATLTPAACCLDRTPTAVTRLRALAPSALRRRGCAFSERSPVHTAWHQRTQYRAVSGPLWMQQRIRAGSPQRAPGLLCQVLFCLARSAEVTNMMDAYIFTGAGSAKFIAKGQAAQPAPPPSPSPPSRGLQAGAPT